MRVGSIADVFAFAGHSSQNQRTKDYETLGTLLLKLGCDEMDTSGLGCGLYVDQQMASTD